MREATYRLEDFGIGTPYAAQARFIRSNVPNVYFMGGRGSGKTTAGVIKSLLYCLKPENAGLDFGLFAPTYRSLVRVAEPQLQKCFDAFSANAGFSLLKKHYRSDHAYELINGTKIYCTSFERVDRIRSMSLCGMWVDEIEYAGRGPVGSPYYVFGTIAAAVRGGGLLQCMLTSTPRGVRGMARRFLDAHREGDKDFQLIISKSQDNPYITPAFLARLKASMSATAYAQEVEARLCRPASTVFGKEFSRQVHVIPYVHDVGTPYSVGIDPGYSKPHVVFVAHNRNLGEQDRDVVFDEIAIREVPEGKMLGLLESKFNELGRMPEMIASDRALPGFNQRMMRKFHDTKIKTRRSKSEQEQWSGLEVVRSLIDPSSGPPKLFFSDRLLKYRKDGIIHAMENAPRVIRHGEVLDQMAKSQGGMDDPIDALSYICTALYGRRGFGTDDKQRPGDLYSRRMRALHKR